MSAIENTVPIGKFTFISGEIVNVYCLEHDRALVDFRGRDKRWRTINRAYPDDFPQGRIELYDAFLDIEDMEPADSQSYRAKERLTARDTYGNVIQITTSSTGRRFETSEIWEKLATYEETCQCPHTP